jgi:hypothetical protein
VRVFRIQNIQYICVCMHVMYDKKQRREGKTVPVIGVHSQLPTLLHSSSKISTLSARPSTNRIEIKKTKKSRRIHESTKRKGQ